MQNLSGKTLAILISLLMIASIGASTTLLQDAHAQLINYPSESFINVAPNPIGVGQSVTVDFFLAVPLEDSERAVNMTVYVTSPAGTTTTLGPFVSDITGGTSTQYVPTAPGVYSFYMKYGGQTLTVEPYTGDYEEPSTSPTVTLTVQSTPVSGIPYTPLPTQYWQTPVNAENVQNWYAITGPWLGLDAAPFASTGDYNATGNFNPYTTGPTTAHILWTKPWIIGGVAGGDAGGTETSDYWTTSQYEPRWNPVVIDGIEYSTWYTTDTSYSNGIVAYNLYDGQNMWIINTTNSLYMGMQVDYESPNQYGVCGPYIVTTGSLPPGDTGGTVPKNTGTQFNLYDALTGKYVCSIVNGISPSFMTVDSIGDPVGYYVNESTPGVTNTETVHPNALTTVVQTVTGPTLNAWNMTQCLGESTLVDGEWTIAENAVFQFSAGIMWAAQTIPTTINGQLIGTNTPLEVFDGFVFGGYSGLNGGGLTMAQIGSNVIVLTYGAGTTAAPSVGETSGWLLEAGFSQTNGAFLWMDNRTETPFTRLSENFYDVAGDGVYVDLNMATNIMNGYSLTTGDLLWTNTLTGTNGAAPNPIDDYGIQDIVDTGTSQMVLGGLGGDIWDINLLTGTIIWYTNTTTLTGSSKTETPYGIWPIWVQYMGVIAGQNNLVYLSEGHEYSPPLFHGSQQLCLNMTNGDLVWTNLGFDDTGGAVAYGILTTYNSYDGQIYAYGQGPSKTTVEAPNPVGTVGSPMVIEGTVTDVSAGASQEAVAANFPNGIPCVSDASMSQFMEYVYEQQPEPTNTTGIPITLTAIDPNGNLVTLGTTTSTASGSWGITWTPPAVPGDYTITATFAGTGGYYGSSAQTLVHVVSAPTPAPPTAAPVTGLASFASLEYGIVAVIIVIIIIGAILAILLLRKRP
jgi:hypothetical protein